MPELDFVLPHWAYWSGLILFPMITMVIYRKIKSGQSTAQISLPVAYVLLLMGGIVGVHRFYLKSKWAVVFVLLFMATLVVNIEVREARNVLSGADNKIMLAEYKIEKAQKDIKKGRKGAEQKLEQARERLTQAQSAQRLAADNQSIWQNTAQALGAAIVLLVLVDVFLLPGLVRKRNLLEPPPDEQVFHCPAVEAEHEDSREPFLISRIIYRINGLAGEFVAYWSLIAVVVYYYEVMARYMFNSPTNWAHESMFLMFGMQYLLAGGFVLREGAHVRVDVLYMHFTKRAKAVVDLVTSVFFFIFMATLLVTGWIFFSDSFAVSEVSFTEWGIQYWPIKFAIPLGAALLLLQGIAVLIKDIAVIINPDQFELQTEVRPEG